MLVLSRKEGERLVIGENIVITVNRISGNRITLGIDAPRDVRIVRGELEPREEISLQESGRSNARPEEREPRCNLSLEMEMESVASRAAG